MKNFADITPTQFRRAAVIRENIDHLASELHTIFGLELNPSAPETPTPTKHRSKRRMSDETKAKISAAAKLRWKKARAKGRTTL